MNLAIIKGNIARDIEMRYTASQTAVSNFSIAVNRPARTNDEGQRKQEADFIPCVAFGKTAEFIERYFSKGKPILVQGQISVRQYDDKDGNKRTFTSVLVDRCEFAGGEKSERRDGGQTHGTAQETFDGFQTLDDDSIPF